MLLSELFASRRTEAQRRLDQLRTQLRTRLDCIEAKFPDPDVCIYATGSLARLEATENSDLDAFFLLSGKSDDNPLGRIRDVRILNAVLLSAEDNGFPDFSNDGEYLKFLHIEDVLHQIGGREDDYNNALTARMLMLLESKYLYNEELYGRFKKKLIEAYFEDFHDHSKSFRPIFLLNDVIRFWRTMCLNYENGRQWRMSDSEKSAKGHLANLKLKFSRLNICYSFISHLLNKGSTQTPEDVLETSALTPIERLQDIRDSDAGFKSAVDLLLEEYKWFLEKTAPEKRKVLEWIGQSHNREDAFAHAANFVEETGKLVQAIAEKNGYLRYLIV